MAAFFGAIAAIILFAFGLVVGVHVGEELAKRVVTRRDYWRYNLEALGAGVLVSALVWATGWRLLVGVSFGLLVGVISGLKMGFGESIGPWGAVDRRLGTNRDQVRRASEPARAEAVRRARRDGTEEPEVMSVAAQPASQGSSDGAGRRAGKRGRRRGVS